MITLLKCKKELKNTKSKPEKFSIDYLEIKVDKEKYTKEIESFNKVKTNKTLTFTLFLFYSKNKKLKPLPAIIYKKWNVYYLLKEKGLVLMLKFEKYTVKKGIWVIDTNHMFLNVDKGLKRKRGRVKDERIKKRRKLHDDIINQLKVTKLDVFDTLQYIMDKHSNFKRVKTDPKLNFKRVKLL